MYTLHEIPPFIKHIGRIILLANGISSFYRYSEKKGNFSKTESKSIVFVSVTL